MKLRPYQARALARFRSSASRSVLLVAPTGAGKGTMATHVMAGYAKRGLKSLFLVHRREIVHDITRRLEAHGVHVAQTLRSSSPARVISVQRALRSETMPVDLVVVDEAHHYAADEWSEVMSRIETKRIIGFTATPQRSDGRSLGDMFDEILDVVSYSQLVAAGHLTPCRVLRPPARIQKTEIACDPAEAYLRYAHGERALIFVRRVAEAERVASELRAAGVRAEAVSGATHKQIRDSIMRRLKTGTLDVVVNVGVLTEGVDVPHVTAVVLAKPCAHASSYVQIVGRVLRAAPGKVRATVVDLVGASFVHGLPNQDRLYTLDGAGMGTVNLRDDSRSGPSGERAEVALDNLDLELEEVDAVGQYAPPLPAPVRRIPDAIQGRRDEDLNPDELARREALRTRRERDHETRPERIARLANTAQDYGAKLIGRVAITPHGTTLGGLFQSNGFWFASYVDADKKKVRAALCTKDRPEAEEALELLRREGPAAMQAAVLMRKRSGASIYKNTGQTNYKLHAWNADKTERVKLNLCTEDRAEAEELCDLYARGRFREFQERVATNKEKSQARGDERRSVASRRAYARAKAV